jgi:hypothetical protein
LRRFITPIGCGDKSIRFKRRQAVFGQAFFKKGCGAFFEKVYIGPIFNYFFLFASFTNKEKEQDYLRLNNNIFLGNSKEG